MKISPKLKRYLKGSLLTLLALTLLGTAAILSLSFYVQQSSKGQILSPQAAADLDDVDCILVLGCSVRGGQPSIMLKSRLDCGISLYDLGVSDRLLMSGDHGQDSYNEVIVMKNYALQANVPSEHVFMDHAGFSTYESMYRARDIFQAKKIVIVTQKYHLYRAIYIAEALGLEAYGVEAAPRDDSMQAQRDFREILARSKDVLYTLFTPKPTYLGEAIPVSGDGNVTDS